MLDGIHVLDLGSVGPGARAWRILADFGARVTRVAPPAGRGVTLPFYAYGALRDVRTCTVDLRRGEGQAVVLDLAAAADVVIEGFRPGVAGRLGVGYQDVTAINPAVVYCSATGYGQDGPRAGWAGHDLNYLAVSGYLHCSGTSGGEPALPGATIADAAGGGMHAALSIMAALLARRRTGAGCHLDVAAADGVLALMAMHLDEHLATGADPGPGSGVLTGRYACYGVYACADGQFLSVAAIEPKFFANLCTALDQDELAALQYDEARQPELRAALAATFIGRPRDEWVTLLAGQDTCVAPVLSVAEVAADAAFADRGAFGSARHEAHGEFRQVGPVWAGAPRADEPVLLRGDCADEVLRGIGYDDERIRQLRESGVIS